MKNIKKNKTDFNSLEFERLIQEERKRNIESNKELIYKTRLEQRELFKLLNKFTLEKVEV